MYCRLKLKRNSLINVGLKKYVFPKAATWLAKSTGKADPKPCDGNVGPVHAVRNTLSVPGLNSHSTKNLFLGLHWWSTFTEVLMGFWMVPMVPRKFWQIL